MSFWIDDMKQGKQPGWHYQPNTARKTSISTGRESLFSTGLPTGTGWPVLNETSFSTDQNAQY